MVCYKERKRVERGGGRWRASRQLAMVLTSNSQVEEYTCTKVHHHDVECMIKSVSWLYIYK
jgi:hypothetical protein